MVRRLMLATALVVASIPSSALAGGTRTFDVSSYEELDKGETRGAAIEASGKITVGYVSERGELTSSTAFTCISTAKAALVGTADKATIVRIEPVAPKVVDADAKTKAKAAKSDKKKDKAGDEKPASRLKVQQIAELPGVVVSAMLELPGGDVLAATLPGGKIHRVSRKGEVTAFAELKVDQIWALTLHRDRILAATGPKGELWSMSTSGKDAKVVLDVTEKDLMSVAVIGEHVLVGTAPEAKLYRVSSELEGVLLHDFQGDELKALARSGNDLLAAVNTFEDRKLSSLDALTKTLNRTSLTGQPPAGSLDGDAPLEADAALFRVDLGAKPDADRASEAPWEAWLQREKQYFTDIEPLGDGATVLVSTSDSGKIYRVRGARDVSTVADLDERQATALCRLPKGEVFAATAHGGAVYQLSTAPASSARYRTEVFDAEHPASFGAVVLRGKGSLTVRARTGPSEEPDERWSEWKSIAMKPQNVGWRGNLEPLARRRFVQVEAVLGDSKTELHALEVFYAPENLPPLLKAVELARPDATEDEEPASDVTISWKVDARDDDELVYDVRVRREGGNDSDWIKINRGDELVTKKELKWDLTTVPDGVYEVEVVASDEPSNGTAQARTDELRSAPFVVDRQRPVVSDPRIAADRIQATARDAGGYVKDVAFSIDGGPFRAASPADGLFDGPEEKLEIVIPSRIEAGSHTVVIRARDSFGNIGSLAVIIKR